jgi:plastocyanin
MASFLCVAGKRRFLMVYALIQAAMPLGWQPAFAGPEKRIAMIEQMQFSPQSLEVRQGDEVVWKNHDLIPHNVSADNGSFRSPVIQPGGSWTFKAIEKGNFPYICSLHPTMKARLIVR